MRQLFIITRINMNSCLILCLPFDRTRLLGPSQPSQTGSENKPSPTAIDRLKRWREKNRTQFEASRINGMKRSERVRANLLRIHAECKAQWRASALKNPKLQSTELHIAAREWSLRAPDGQIHSVRNLKKFVRDNPELFDESDVIWKAPEGKPQQAWCRAFQGLSRLRPSGAKTLEEWQGWTWAKVAKLQPTTTAAKYSAESQTKLQQVA